MKEAKLSDNFEPDENQQENFKYQIKEAIDKERDEIKSAFFQRYFSNLNFFMIDTLFRRMCTEESDSASGAEKLRKDFYNQWAKAVVISVEGEIKGWNDRLNSQNSVLDGVFRPSISTEDIQKASNQALREISGVFFQNIIREEGQTPGSDSD